MAHSGGLFVVCLLIDSDSWLYCMCIQYWFWGDYMPRRSDIETAFRASVVYERSGRRIVNTADFVQELLKVN